MDRVYTSKSFCSGCSACYSICPVKAINMQSDRKGFFYPVIDTKTCIDCGLCVKVCPLNKDIKKNEPLKFYGLKNANIETRLTSSSGGVFFELAKYVIKQSGVVYGASYDENLKVCHNKAETIEDCIKFKGSKYVKSDLKETFLEIKSLVKNKKLVLFSALPCEVAGLKNFIGKSDYLICIDLICNGGPSPKIFEEFKRYQEKKFNKNLESINFRFKEEASKKIKFIFKDNSVKKESIYNSFYFKLYGMGLIDRKCCFSCKFNNLNRVGDITIGDYWGVEKYFKTFDDSQGVSLSICNTPKGYGIFNKVLSNFEFIELTKEQSLQPRINNGGVKKKFLVREFWILNKIFKVKTVYNIFIPYFKLRRFVGKMVRKILR